MLFSRALPVTCLALAAPVTAWAQSFARSATGTNITALFAPGLSPGASIHFPSDPDYANETIQRWSTYDPPTFVVTIKPAVYTDVQFIVKQADRHNIPIYATGGAHGAEPGFGNVKHAINIDLSNFNTTDLNTATNRLTLGPGIVFADLYDLLYNAGKEIPTGNALCVNMIGATIGAGVGPLQGLHGLIIDALRSVLIVTAAGDLVTASDTQHPGLFWAVRGAGANFGIIVSATYEVYDAKNNGQVIEADFQFLPSANRSLWEVLKSWDSSYPAEMGLTIGAGFNRSGGVPTLGASVSFVGTQAQAQPYLDKFLALNPILSRVQSIGWNQLAIQSGFGSALRVCTRGQYANHYGVGANQTNVNVFTDVYNRFAAFSAARPWYAGTMAVQRYSSAAALAVPISKRGVYPWRDIGTLIEFNNFYDGPVHDAEVDAFCKPARSDLLAVSGFPTPHVYINYAFGDEGPEVWYGKANLPRLVALKKRWDPKNKFGAGNPIYL